MYKKFGLSKENTIELFKKCVIYKDFMDREQKFECVNEDFIINILKSQETEYEVFDIDIPERFLKFDGIEFKGTFEEAVLMLNDENSYKIKELKNKLDNDFRKNKRLDGEYNDNEWAEIAEERRAWRHQLRELIKSY